MPIHAPQFLSFLEIKLSSFPHCPTSTPPPAGDLSALPPATTTYKYSLAPTHARPQEAARPAFHVTSPHPLARKPIESRTRKKAKRPTDRSMAVAVAAKKRRSSVLGALREAIGKVRFVLSFSATRWMLLASSAAAARRAPARRLSFDARPGLLEVEGSIVAPSPASSSSSRMSRSASLGTATARSLSRTSNAASPAAQMKRTSSSVAGSPYAGDDDIDQRAEMFIANFYRQLRMERQVSLQLRYLRGNSWDRTP
ncbi:hypothetical protein BS78_07G153300 [Paspalum vaginatum]|nr:hypothetical protein BS78_07G153300 [Paspalum vaginatum]